MNTPSFYGIQGRQGQQGAALIVVLMLLIVVTLLGLASMRGAIMQERMAANTLARAAAFQAAEAGMREAELSVRDGTIAVAPTSGCSAGRCASPVVTATPPWDVNSFWTNTSSPGYRQGTALGSGPTAIQPRYVIEDYGMSTGGAAAGGQGVDGSKEPVESPPDQAVFRITSYASTPNGPQVMLQSLYRR
jgi:type IV pilus assembly protein PilX